MNKTKITVAELHCIYTFLHSFYFPGIGYKPKTKQLSLSITINDTMNNFFFPLINIKLNLLTLSIIVFHWQTVCSQDSNKNLVSTPDGLIYEILSPGSGQEATPGQEVVVHEQMGYRNGTILYSTKPGGPVRFLLGGGQAIKGVDLGVQGMKVGEQRKLIVPPELSKRSAYPNFLSPDSTLLYEIELLNIIPPEDFPPLSAKGKIVQQVGFNTITIEYERPSVRGRKIYGGLVPFDTLWKTGAGSGVKIRVSEPVSIEENNIEAGTYALMTIPDRDTWTLILTKDTTFYINRKEYEPEKEVARFQVKPEKTARFYESFTIDVDVIPHNADIYLSWENTQVKFTLNTGTDEKIDSYVKESLLSGKSQNPGLYATAADYYYFGNKELETALTLVDMAIKKGPEPWHYRLKMDILERMNRNEEAIKVAQSAIEFINENSAKLGWDVETKQSSISFYNKRIEDLKESMRK